MSNLADETRIAETLVQKSVITIEQLKKAVEFRDSIGGAPIRDIVIKLGYASEAKVSEALGEQKPATDVQPIQLDVKAMSRVPSKIFDTHKCVLLKPRGQSRGLLLAMADPNNLAAIEELRFLTGQDVEPVVANPASIQRALKLYHQMTDRELEGSDQDSAETASSPTSRGGASTFASSGSKKSSASISSELDNDDDIDIDDLDPEEFEDVPHHTERKLSALDDSTLLRAFVLAMIQRGAVSLEDILSCAERIEKGEA